MRLNTRKFLEVLRKRPQITKELSKTLTLKEVENVEDGVFYEVSLYSDFSSGKEIRRFLKLFTIPTEAFISQEVR